MTMLTACQQGNTFNVEVIPEGTKIPPLTAELRRLCDIPGLKEGQDARVALFEHRVALLDCAERHGGVVAFIDKVTEIVNRRETHR